MTKTVIAGALGECVHVAGVSHFLRLAEVAGWRTIFLGPAASIESFLPVAHRLRSAGHRVTIVNGMGAEGEELITVESSIFPLPAKTLISNLMKMILNNSRRLVI